MESSDPIQKIMVMSTLVVCQFLGAHSVFADTEQVDGIELLDEWCI